MAEPQPEELPPQPTAAEKKSEAAALSTLSNTTDEESAKTAASNTQDGVALGAALSNLGADKEVAGQAVKAPETKKAKIDVADVNFLVTELEVSKKKATEMLQSAHGDRMAALKTFIQPRGAKA